MPGRPRTGDEPASFILSRLTPEIAAQADTAAQRGQEAVTPKVRADPALLVEVARRLGECAAWVRLSLQRDGVKAGDLHPTALIEWMADQLLAQAGAVSGLLEAESR